jgi:hypothetical protein
MLSISIRDSDGLDPARPSTWLPVGRECRPSLQTTHTIAIRCGDKELAAARVGRAGSNAVRIDSLRLPDGSPRTLLAALIYCGLREARIVGRTLADIQPGPSAAAVGDLLRSPLRPDGVVRQRVDYAMHRTFTASGTEVERLLADSFASEVVRTIEHCLYPFFTTGTWAETIRRGSLSRGQYVATLFNMHSYVRYSTRLLGHCIGLSDDRRLRAHYIEHLKGEINHERIIERDLAHLGEDVEYVVENHQPTSATLRFMCVQESLVGFYRDPVLFLACPLAGESFAAYLPEDLLEGLRQSAIRWGCDDPKEVVHFVQSHTVFDGGLDGHWNAGIQLLGHYLREEARMQRFSSTLRAAMSALSDMFDSCVSEYAEPAP